MTLSPSGWSRQRLRWCALPKILIAARGVGAVRVIRACADAGIPAVSIWHAEDVTALHVAIAPHTVEIADYVDARALIETALAAGCDAIHPGDSPLAGDADAAAAVIGSGLGWIGNAPETIRAVAEGLAFTAMAARLDIPVSENARAVETGARHVQVQLLGSTVVGLRDVVEIRHGRALATVSRARHGSNAALVRMAEAIARESRATGLMTAEFLETGRECRLIAVTPGLTLEHAVTEAVTGLDLVGDELAAMVPGVRKRARGPRSGCALQVVARAEHASKGFLRASGTISALEEPGGPGVRVDSAVELGTVLSARRDNVLAAVTVAGNDRAQVAQRAARARAEWRIDGVETAFFG